MQLHFETCKHLQQCTLCGKKRVNIGNLQVLTVDRFIVTRRVYVETLYVRNAKKRWSKGMLPADINMLIGK